MHLSPENPLCHPTSGTQMLAPGVAPEPPPGSRSDCSDGCSLSTAAETASVMSAQSFFCLIGPARAPACKLRAGSFELLPGQTSTLHYA